MEKIIGKYKIEVEQDENAESPRTSMDNFGTMVCFHSSYNLGDKHDYVFRKYTSWEEMKNDIIRKEKVGVILPLYLYVHSGKTMKTTSFNDTWDSGQVGFIFVSKEKMLKEYGGKRVGKKLREKVTAYLKGEVETYDQYLTGDVYGYRITNTDTDEEVDSCWGYYGEDYCMKEAEELATLLIADEAVEKFPNTMEALKD
jgi:hypothetical protein